MSFTFPDALHYERNDHVWVRREAGGDVVIGIDELGLENLGDLAYVSLAHPGTRVAQGGAIGSLEAAKMTGDIKSPVAGTVVARNDAACANPGLVNTDCYGAGWLVRIAPDDWDHDAEGLVHGADVAAWVAAEVERFRKEGWMQ